MVDHTRIFLTGGTGYIGGSVLTRLLSHPKAKTFKISALVRSAEKAKKLDALGVTAIVGSTADVNLLASLSSQADVVIACANADDLGATKGILNGLRLRSTQVGTPGVLIHTSGTGVLVDDANGMHSTETIYSDLDIAQLETLPPSQPHREVDLTVIEADKQGYVKTYIIAPSTIYGIASGTLVDQSIQNAYSQQIPLLIEISLKRGQGGMIGAGENIWPNVHIDDIADLYITLLDAAMSDNPPSTLGHGRSGFYFGENGEHKLRDISKAIAEVLFERGRGKSAEPTTLSEEEMNKYFPHGAAFLSSNSRCRADRSKAVGWQPVKVTADMLKSIDAEVEAFIREKELKK